ncbi:carbamate kinase [soil metagenome]
MLIVVALGGNALLRRGAALTSAAQLASIQRASAALAPLAEGNQLVITHGNGPQVGLLALQAAAYDETSGYPFDVLDAQTVGMIGYLLERELRNHLPARRDVTTVVTMTRVAADDPAFEEPTKFVGPVYAEEQALELALERGWVVKPDGESWRRVVASPLPVEIVELRPITGLIGSGSVVICAGGGGVPVVRDVSTGNLVGVEAVVDKDHTSSVLALDLGAERLIIVTDVAAIFEGWGTDTPRALATVHPDALEAMDFPDGSMGPKVAAACRFARRRDGVAVIGALDDLPALLTGDAGTVVTTAHPRTTYR